MTNHENLSALAARAISDYHMLDGARLILVGLSGGADSVAMTHYLKFGRGLSLVACHVNHNLRGHESERDEQFVRELCRLWEVPLIVESARVESYARQKGLGLEEAGRDVRYRFFATVMKSCGADRVATAHTASDNLETVLMNLTRGTARKGLCGIPPIRTAPSETPVSSLPARDPFLPNRMIRPLIFCSRDDVEEYCLHNGLSYVIDSSNMQDDYARNKLRHRVVPVLRGLNPEVTRTVSRTTAVFREEEILLDGMARDVLARALLGEEPPALDREALSAVPRAIQRRALAAFLEQCGVRVNAVLLEDALSIAGTGTGKRMLSPGRYFLVRGDRLLLETPPPPLPYFEFRLEAYPARSSLPSGITLSARLLDALECPRMDTEQKVYKNLLYLPLDYDRIKGTVSIRQKRPGDAFALAGRNGTKTLKKLFTERKLTAYEKSAVPVLSDEEGVIALWGIGPDRRCAPCAETKRLLVIEQAEDGIKKA